MGHTLVFTVVLDAYFWCRGSAECKDTTEQNSPVVKTLLKDPEINQITSMFKKQGQKMVVTKINLREHQ